MAPSAQLRILLANSERLPGAATPSPTATLVLPEISWVLTPWDRLAFGPGSPHDRGHRGDHRDPARGHGHGVRDPRTSRPGGRRTGVARSGPQAGRGPASQPLHAAEGVQHPATAARLTDLDCGFGQGELWSDALRAVDSTRLLRASMAQRG